MNTGKRLACAATTLVATMAAAVFAAEPQPDKPRAEVQAERMLAALGGRDAWAHLTNLINDSEQRRTNEPTVVRTVITLDLTRPRFRIETSAPQLHLIRVIDGERDWRLARTGAIEAVPAETRACDLQWYAGHVYRTIHRIAKRDAALRLETDAQGRLLVLERGSRIAWFKLDERHEPYAYGAHQDDAGSLAGPWVMQSAGIKHPAWTTLADGSFRSQLISLDVNTTLSDAQFARPARVFSFPLLAGDWRGTGEFRGSPTAIALSVQPLLEAQFHELNIALAQRADATAFFSGRALYQRTLEGLRAQWFDSTGNHYSVRGQVDGACLHAEWTTAQGAAGRSHYCLENRGTLAITDELRHASGDWRTFGSYTLQRQP
jgi:hypothetical protein